MARYLSNAKAKLLVTLLADDISMAINRLGFAAVSGGREAAGKAEEKGVTKEEFGPAATAWVPDPVTGYYRPGGGRVAAEIDTGEGRKMVENRTENKAKLGQEEQDGKSHNI